MPSTTGKDKRRAGLLEDSSRIADQALLIARLSLKWQNPATAYPILRSITVYPPSASRNGAWLIVGKAWGDQKRLVAFHRSTDLVTALAGFLAKWWSGKLAWKDDTWKEA